MKIRAGYAALLIGAYLVFVIAQLPAARVVHWLQSSGGALPVALHQIDGSVWRGSAQNMIGAGQSLGRVVWTFRPQALPLGRIEFALDITRDDGRISANAGRSLDGALYLRDARLALPLNDLAMLAGQPDMGLAGRVSADIRRAAFGTAEIIAIEGRIDIAGAGIGAPVNVTLGDFTLDIKTTDDVIRGTLKDKEGPLRTDGVIVMNPDGSYRLNASLSARDPANTELTQALRMIGTPGAGGTVTVTQQGRIAIPKQ